MDRYLTPPSTFQPEDGDAKLWATSMQLKFDIWFSHIALYVPLLWECNQQESHNHRGYSASTEELTTGEDFYYIWSGMEALRISGYNMLWTWDASILQQLTKTGSLFTSSVIGDPNFPEQRFKPVTRLRRRQGAFKIWGWNAETSHSPHYTEGTVFDICCGVQLLPSIDLP